MTILTRSSYSPSIGQRTKCTTEYGTPTRTRFDAALDHDSGSKSLRQIAAESAPSLQTAAHWQQQRQTLGSPSYRRIRKLRLVRPPLTDKSTTKFGVDLRRNPIRMQTLEAQLHFDDMHTSVRTAQTALLQHTDHGRKYNQAYVKKKLSRVNSDKHIAYGKEH